jgi:hypothetical protein
MSTTEREINYNNGGMNGIKNGNTVTLDLRVSCDTFGKYQMSYTIDRDDYIDHDNNSNINKDGCCNEKKTSVFSRLERDLCDAMISYIHEDLLLNRQEEQLQKLCEVSSKFHIHGHTTRSLLYQQSNAPHADHGGLIYICTHC